MNVVRGVVLLALVALVGQAAADTPPVPKIKGKTQPEWLETFEQVRDEPAAKRIALLKLVGEFGSEGNELSSCVSPMFGAFEWELRVVAADTLGKIGAPDTRHSVPALVGALNDEVWEVRRSAARSLGQLGPAATAATKPLIAAVQDKNWAVAREAAASLGKVNPDPKLAIPALTQALQAPQWEVRAAATGSLAPLLLDTSPNGQAAVEKSARDREWVVREAVAEGLGSSAQPKKAVPLLIPLSKDEEWRVRVAALRSLAKIGTADVVVPELIRALSDSDWMVRKASAVALRQIGEQAKDAVPSLEKLYQDPSPDVRKEATAALKVIAPPEKAP